MNPETHEAALLAAYKSLPYRPGLHDIEPLIKTYLREAGLVVVPAAATDEQHDEIIDALNDGCGPYSIYAIALAAFKSPFGEE